MGGPTSEWPAKGGDDGENEVPQGAADAGTSGSGNLDASAPRPVDDGCTLADGSLADGGIPDADVPSDGGCR